MVGYFPPSYTMTETTKHIPNLDHLKGAINMEYSSVPDLRTLRNDITRFFMSYKFALKEMETKVSILKEEFQATNEYNLIEHISTRLKSPESILRKITKKGIHPSIDAIQKTVRDIAGIRITCSFVDDIYKVKNMIQNQHDITVVEVKDYIQNPKPNGYQSLHLIIQVPILCLFRWSTCM